MGVPLSKPVLTRIQERYGNDVFRCGSCCVNGYRESMEDAHLVYLQPNWGFFGVFDGHVNDECSTYLENAWRAVMEREKDNIPLSDDRLREITLQIDQEWMNSGREGGSTGTFFIGIKEGNAIHLQVGNVGDSRVVACINGVCNPLTEDHKPNNETERQRIEECGGRVENNRVDSCLAVSRAFGDRDYKTNSAGQLKQKVIALADVTHADVTYNSDDFVILCCDGVFEGEFTNEDVICFIKDQLRTTNDLCEVAARVCEEAIERGSRDNISCVIVQFKNGQDYNKDPHHTIVPGPFSVPRQANFRKAYENMAEKGMTTVGALLEKRYDAIRGMTNPPTELEEELSVFGEGPPLNLMGAARTEWFCNLYQHLCETYNSSPQSDMDRIQFIQQQVGVPLTTLLSMMGDASIP
ncbi:unnamed protein product [Phytomonas sp. EM1]|nr:unnamed protein product [Phytomonas sp. EM1]|eukprot:CCW63416.1 unnamed protein product [Phytomonas sp. isolate EM1]